MSLGLLSSMIPFNVRVIAMILIGNYNSVSDKRFSE